MKNSPLVSIIMSEYNTNHKLLAESIQSILNQTYTNLELIIINDGSSKYLNKLVKDLDDKRIHVYSNKKNMGLVYSLNKGIKLSNGKYIARMDTDDISFSDRICRQVEFLENNKNIDMVCSNAELWDGVNVWGATKLSGIIDKNTLAYGNPIIHPSVMMKKDTVVGVGLYPDYKRAEDYALWLKLCLMGKNMFCMKDNLVRYHLSKNDYKKKDLCKRIDYINLINSSLYKELYPKVSHRLIVITKAFVAGIVPKTLLYKYHVNKYHI